MLPLPTILLVDDDETTRHIMRWLLNELCAPGSVRILEAPHGAQALKLMRAHGEAAPCIPPLLVLLDLHMPTMGGLEFMERISSLPLGCQQVTTVVVVSGTLDSTEHEAAIKLADAFRRKPMTMPELSKLLWHYLPDTIATAPL